MKPEAFEKCPMLFKLKEGEPAKAGLTPGTHYVF
jgi:hypothetical protein